MLLTVLKAFRGLVFNSSKRWDNLVVGKLPPDAADNLFNTSLCVGGGFSSKRFFASFHREIASLLSIIDWFQIVDTCNEYKLRRVTAFHSMGKDFICLWRYLSLHLPVTLYPNLLRTALTIFGEVYE